jgi:hypothetical protein
VAAVKEAVGTGVQVAVRAVLTELLANPELLHTPEGHAGQDTVSGASSVATAGLPDPFL